MSLSSQEATSLFLFSLVLLFIFMMVVSLAYIYGIFYFISRKDKKKNLPTFLPILKKALMINGLNLLITGYAWFTSSVVVVVNIFFLLLLSIPSSLLYYHWIFKENTTKGKAIANSIVCTVISNIISFGYIIIILFGSLILSAADFLRQIML